jgi:hypothetical protein
MGTYELVEKIEKLAGFLDGGLAARDPARCRCLAAQLETCVVELLVLFEQRMEDELRDGP